MAFKRVIGACLAAGLLSGPAFAVPHASRDQDASARRGQPQGLSVREIERRVVPMVQGAQYLGFDYDPDANIYTLKFLRNGSVIWVDVDGRSGRILRRAGS